MCLLKELDRVRWRVGGSAWAMFAVAVARQGGIAKPWYFCVPDHQTGAKFYTPPPLKMTWGHIKEGRREKLLPRGASKYTSPPPLPEKYLLAKIGRGGCIYIYICICCEVIIWSKFGVFESYHLVQVGVLESYYLVQVCFLAYENSGFKRFLRTQ